MEQLDQEFSEIFDKIIGEYGMHELQARVLGILYLEPDEISLEEIAKRTGYSLASISNTMRIIINLGLIRRIKKPKSAKIYFYMEKNLIKLNIMKLKSIQENFVKPAKGNLPIILQKYHKAAKSDKSEKKLQIVKGYYDQILEFEPIIDKWIMELENLIQKKINIKEK